MKKFLVTILCVFVFPQMLAVAAEAKTPFTCEKIKNKATRTSCIEDRIEKEKVEATEKEKIAATSAKNTASAQVYSQEPLNVSADILPPDYLGHSCLQVAAKLKESNLNKGEFEPTTEYEKRLAEIGASPLYGNIRLVDTLAFKHRDRFFTPSYNADTQLMEIRINFSTEMMLIEPAYHSVSAEFINLDISSKNTYTASNSYGATATVTRENYNACLAVFKNTNAHDTLTSKTIKATFTIPPDEAKNVKENLAILYIGKLAYPYNTKYRKHVEATISSPTELIYEGDVPVINLDKVWVYDKFSGKIFAKISPIYH